MKTATLIRRAGMAVLAGVIALAGWDLLSAEPDPFADAEEALHERVEHYMQMRRDDNWLELYGLTDPRQRRLVDAKKFLNSYDNGLLDVTTITAEDYRIDTTARRALVKLTVDAQLDVEALPPKIRAGFREDHPEHMQKHMEHDMRWTWFGGEWFFLMDDEVITGRDSRGNEVSFDHAEESQ